MSDFLGSRISLISKSDIRYAGTLHEINSDDSTVSLENVRSFGTEGRRGKPEEEVAPSDQVYEYIVFRGSDVKDLRIEESPNIKENQPPAMPDDPAILGARPHPGAPAPNQNQGPMPPPGGRFDQGPYPPNNFYGGPPPPGAWGRGGPPGPGPGPAFGNMPYPPPPGWFPPGQGFPPGGPGGPGPWSQPQFPPGPGGPPGPLHPGPVPESKSPFGPGAEQGKPTAPSGHPVPPTEPKSLAQPGRQQANAPEPPVESKPSIDEVKATAAAVSANAAASQGKSVPKTAPTGPRSNRPAPVIPLSGAQMKPFQPQIATERVAQATVHTTTAAPVSVQDATDAARAAVAMAMSQLGNTGGNAMDNLTKKVNEMRVNAGRGGQASRSRGRGPRQPTAKVDIPDSDFDFAQANAKFNKDDLVKEAIAGSPLAETPNGSAHEAQEPTLPSSVQSAYNKTSSFFDNISSEAKDRAENGGQKPGGREWRGEEQRRNMETFGQGSVDGGYRYRGRGRGRGGRGHGFGRGGRGGNRPQYEAATGEN